MCRQCRDGVTFALLQKNVFDRQPWSIRQELRLVTVAWIERPYHLKRRQHCLGRLTPIEFETMNAGLKAAESHLTGSLWLGGAPMSVVKQL